MKMTLNLSYEEGTAVLDAMRKAANETGRSYEEIEYDNLMEEYATILDACLTAIGIEVRICDTPTPIEDEDEVDDFDDESDFDEDEDEEEDEEPSDTTSYTITPKGRFVALCLEQGISWEEATETAEKLFPTQPQPDAIERMIVERNGKRCLTETNANRLLRIICDTVRERMEDSTQQEWAEMVTNIFLKVTENYRIEEVIVDE